MPAITQPLITLQNKKTSGGYVALDAKQTIGYTKGNYNAVTKLQNKGTSYTLFAGYNMHDYRKSIDNKKDVIHFTDTDINRQYNTLDGRSKGNSQYAQLNVLNANNNRTLRASAMIVRDNSPGNYSTDILTYTGLPDGDKQTTSRSESSQRGIKYNTNFMAISTCLKPNLLKHRFLPTIPTIVTSIFIPRTRLTW